MAMTFKQFVEQRQQEDLHQESDLQQPEVTHSQFMSQWYNDVSEDWCLDSRETEANEAEDYKLMELEGLTDDD